MAKLTEAIESLNTLTAYTLANMADVNCSDAEDSEGALFLTRTRDSVVESLISTAESWLADNDEDVDAFRSWVEDYGNESGTLSELQDEAPSIYNNTRMQQLVDLGAWSEDVSEFGQSSDVLEAAGWALYIVAGRLIWALVADLQDQDS